MIVFWSSDPEATTLYGGSRARSRRHVAARSSASRWCTSIRTSTTPRRYLGGKWIAPRPGTDAGARPGASPRLDHRGPLRQGVRREAHHRLRRVEGLRPRRRRRHAEDPRVAGGGNRRAGRDVRALAREWGTKKTYLGAGGWGVGVGGACRGATGMQWARMMVMPASRCRGSGRPGVNFGNLQFGTPLDFNFYFPGYAEGGISGDLEPQRQRRQPLPAHAAHADHELGRRQGIPRMWLPEAIIDGKAEGYPDRRVDRGPVPRFTTRRPGHVPVQMLYKYGGALFGTMVDSEPLGRRCTSTEKLRVRRQPVDLEGGRGEVRRRHPARLHGLRALGHRRVVRRRRLRASQCNAEQPPRDHSCSTSASSRWASRSPTTTSSRDLASGSGSAPCSRKADRPSSTGASACSTRPTCRSTSPGGSS